MRIFVAGATGAIGRPLIRQLLAHGSIQSIYSMRNPDKLKRLSEEGVIKSGRQELRG